jgi:hypothetical protein
MLVEPPQNMTMLFHPPEDLSEKSEKCKNMLKNLLCTTLAYFFELPPSKK